MSNGLGPYPAYKHTDVPSLGDVPKHWDVVPLGRIGRISKANGGNKEDEVPAGIPCVRYGDLYTTHEFFIRSTRAFVGPERVADYTPIRYGDVLFAASGETLEDIGKSAVNLIESEARCGGDVLVMRPSMAVVPEFLGYASDSYAARHQKALVGRGFTIVHMYATQLNRLLLALPPLDEQSAIVRFLNHANRCIRRYVAARRKLITLLNEEKQAVILRAVTRGLDPNVRLKPSGVEWLGDVPDHWEVVPSRAMFKHRNQKAPEGQEILTASQAHGIITRSDFMTREGRRVMQVITGRDILKQVEPNDFVISMRSFEGGLEWARIPGAISSAYVVLAPTEEIHAPYYAHLLKTRAYISALRRTSDLVRDGQALRYANFVQIPLPRVPVSEQKEIAAFLHARVARSRSMTSHVEREIKLVREYRTRLIADVISGKLDVRKAAAKLAAEVEQSAPPDDSSSLADTNEFDAEADLDHVPPGAVA